MISDYGTLKTWLATRINRTDATDVIPDCVRSAHDIIVGEAALAADLSISTQSTALPTGFRQAIGLWLVNRPMIQLSEASEEVTQYISGTGVPYVFRIDTTLKVYPTPAATYLAKLHYRISRDFFASDSATNAVLTRYPMVYAWLALSELHAHFLDEARSDKYLAKGLGELRRLTMVETSDATRAALQMSSIAP